ncbi:MAG: c-type cytochrome [Hyphomicrobiales bacterium]|nr:c-type cytochrome [Hyphomicrobiales bacterium]
MPSRGPAGTLLRAAGAIVATVSCFTLARSSSVEQDFSKLERGRYLTTLADCAACHRDPIQGRDFAGGRPIETPFGNVLAPNITPDRETGIGNWSDAEFDTAVRRGKRPDGKLLYPAMPFPYYARMSKEDVAAIRAYLNTMQPVHNLVEPDQLPFPLDLRVGMRVWDALYFKDGSFLPNPSKSAAWNRGAELVEGPGHCGACHTPKTLLGGDKTDRALRGYSMQGWFAPDITNDERLGLGAWTAADIVDYLKSGHNRFAAASGPMAEEVSYSTSRMKQDDLEAIATYLKDIPAESAAAAPLSADDPSMQAGAAIYRDLCAACHKLDGTGVATLFPNLAASSSVASREPTSLIRVVLRGGQSVSTSVAPTGPRMPAFGWQLNDAELAALLTYIRNSWGHAAMPVTERTVRNARSRLAARND